MEEAFMIFISFVDNLRRLFFIVVFLIVIKPALQYHDEIKI